MEAPFVSFGSEEEGTSMDQCNEFLAEITEWHDPALSKELPVFAIHQKYDEDLKECILINARVLCLVIHYGFELDDAPSRRRLGNKEDLKNLNDLFAGFRNVHTKFIKSPLSIEIPDILSDNTIKSYWPNLDEPPTLFFLFILSHGDENGVIFTDTRRAAPYDFFTVGDVLRHLKEVQFLKNATKVNIFAPCRGTLKEERVSTENAELKVGPNSTRILLEPNEDNFINIFSTIETEKAYSDNGKGSLIIQNFHKILSDLKEDMDMPDFLRKVRSQIIQFCDLENEIHQTSQMSIFPHPKLTFLAKSVLRDEAIQSAPPTDPEVFNWGADKNRRALVFSEEQSNQVLKFMTGLRNGLQFGVHWQHLSRLQSTLTSVAANNMLGREGGLFVVVFAPIEEVLSDEPQKASGLGVPIESDLVIPIANLKNLFVASRCGTFAALPKIFMFLDSETRSENLKTKIKVMETPVEWTNNHSEFLTLICSGKERINRLAEELFDLNDRSLENAFYDAICTPDTTRLVPQIWTTTSKKVVIPNLNTKQPLPIFKSDSNGSIQPFETFVASLVGGSTQLFLVHSFNVNEVTPVLEELHCRCVISGMGQVVVFVRRQQLDDFMSNFGEGKKPSAVDFLLYVDVNNRLLREVHCRKVFMIVDNGCGGNEAALSLLVEMMMFKKYRLLVLSTGTQTNDMLLSMFAKKYEIEVFGMETIEQESAAVFAADNCPLDQSVYPGTKAGPDNLSQSERASILGQQDNQILERHHMGQAESTKPPCQSKISWVKATGGEVPEGAFLAGQDFEKYSKVPLDMFICRLEHDGNVLPGKVVPHRKLAYVCYDGYEHQKQLEYEVLCGDKSSCQWVRTSIEKPRPVQAVSGGKTEEVEVLYIGKVRRNDAQVIGYVQYSKGKCFIPYDGWELEFTKFEILVHCD